jgi:Pre ATP-grasp domain
VTQLSEWLSGGSPAQVFVHGQGHADRALVLARPQDIVCVPDEVDPAYLAYLSDLGLGPRRGHVVAASRFGPPPAADRALWARLAGSADALRALADLLRRNGVTHLHPYSALGGERCLAAALEVAADAELRVAAPDPTTAEYADQKHHIRAKAIELGVPVAPGEVVTLPRAGGRRRRDYDALRAAVERHLRPTGRAIVRGAQGVAGASTFVVGGRGEDVDGLLRRLSQREDNRVYLVEVLVPATVSPHVQMHVAPDGGPIVCAGVTDQRWERPFVHGGNVYPSTGRSVQAMLDWSDRLARWLQGQGYAGLLGLDFVEYMDPNTGDLRTILAELHPGMDGATYPLALQQRLNAAQREWGRRESAAFVSGTLELRPMTFTLFRRMAEPFMYAPRTGHGFVPYHVSRLAQGRCGVVMLGGSRDDVLRAYGELQTWCRWEGR